MVPIDLKQILILYVDLQFLLTGAAMARDLIGLYKITKISDVL